MAWTPSMDERLFETLVEMVRAGMRAELGFKKEAWNCCIRNVKEVMGDDPLREHLDAKKCKTKTDTNKQRWREWVILRNKPGWWFDEITERFQATDEMWDDHINVSRLVQFRSLVLMYGIQAGHNTAAWLRRNTLLYRDKLEEIFEEGIVTSNHAATAQEALNAINADDADASAPPTPNGRINDEDGENILAVRGRRNTARRKETTDHEPSPVPTKRSKLSPGERIAAALDNVSMALSRGYELREKEQEEASRSLQERAMRIIERDFPNSNEEEEDFQFQATTVIEEDSRAKMFLALAPNQRKRWLETKIYSM